MYFKQRILNKCQTETIHFISGSFTQNFASVDIEDIRRRDARNFNLGVNDRCRIFLKIMMVFFTAKAFIIILFSLLLYICRLVYVYTKIKLIISNKKQKTILCEIKDTRPKNTRGFLKILSKHIIYTNEHTRVFLTATFMLNISPMHPITKTVGFSFIYTNLTCFVTNYVLWYK